MVASGATEDRYREGTRLVVDDSGIVRIVTFRSLYRGSRSKSGIVQRRRCGAAHPTSTSISTRLRCPARPNNNLLLSLPLICSGPQHSPVLGERGNARQRTAFSQS